MTRSIKRRTSSPAYSADAHSPWRRGNKANINGLLREYFPRLAGVTVLLRAYGAIPRSGRGAAVDPLALIRCWGTR